MNEDIYYINVKTKKRNTAAMKAPADISEICGRLGFKEFSMPTFPSQKSKFYQRIWLLFICTYYWCKLWKTVNRGDIIIYQHPMYGNRVSAYFIPKIQEHKGCKFIAVIHDLESLRKGIEGVVINNSKTSDISDNVLLKQFDVIICHNNHMKQYLVGRGFEADRLVCLGIFDYLCDYEGVKACKAVRPSIAIAGNLAPGKCSYIYDILNKDSRRNENLIIHLYGENFDEKRSNKQMIYHGSYKPEELPKHLEGDFGLVWDGPSAKTCVGNTGEYLKYNNPHKTSLYLASNIPVIVWSQAAIADFVLENNVGIVIDSLYDLDRIISTIPNDDYSNMCRNAKIIGERIRSGYYFTTAITSSLKILSD